MYEVPHLSATLLISFLAFGFRFACLAQLVGISIALAKAEAPSRTRNSWAAFVVAASCYLLGPVVVRSFPWAMAPIILGALACPFFFWIFTRSFFDDRFRPGVFHLALFTAFELSSYLSYPVFSPILALLFNLFIVIQACVGRNADLLEVRRRAVLRFVVLYTALVFTILGAELFYQGHRVPPSVDLVVQFVCFLFFGFLCHQATHQGVLWFRELPVKKTLSRFDDAFLKRFDHLVRVARVYLRSDLNLRTLSRLLGTPEYLVRQYINEHLNFRNFNDFVNANRIERARELLSSPDGRQLSITSLAFELGFQSLATFNRAFRHYCGQSPSEFARIR